MRRAPVPFWCVLLVGITSALLTRALVEGLGAGARWDTPAPDVQLAFFNFLLAAVGLIFKGLQVAGQVAVQALAWSVKALWAFAIAVNNAAVGLGKLVLRGFRKAWEFLQLTYEEVLKPAWQKFWGWVDRFRNWLERTLEPMFTFLEKIREHVLGFYDKWIRPVLDIIGITRRVLNILAALGLEWARALDRKLADLEDKISTPFRLVLAKINEVINIVNRVVTADGLFQRLALIRSIERDLRFVSRSLLNWRSSPISNEDLKRITKPARDRTAADVKRDFAGAMQGTSGRYGGVVREAQAQWRQRLDAR